MGQVENGYVRVRGLPKSHQFPAGTSDSLYFLKKPIEVETWELRDKNGFYISTLVSYTLRTGETIEVGSENLDGAGRGLLYALALRQNQAQSGGGPNPNLVQEELSTLIERKKLNGLGQIVELSQFPV